MAARLLPGSDLGRFNVKILRELSFDGRITVTDLAGRVGLSKTPGLIWIPTIGRTPLPDVKTS
ncbi:MAG: AsnC family transcriptional regulator [Paracoccaceae bacterium]|nr:AsnC family transcriptional regulator [Paracoccaceae bacterium]